MQSLNRLEADWTVLKRTHPSITLYIIQDISLFIHDQIAIFKWAWDHLEDIARILGVKYWVAIYLVHKILSLPKDGPPPKKPNREF